MTNKQNLLVVLIKILTIKGNLGINFLSVCKLVCCLEQTNIVFAKFFGHIQYLYILQQHTNSPGLQGVHNRV